LSQTKFLVSKEEVIIKVTSSLPDTSSPRMMLLFSASIIQMAAAAKLQPSCFCGQPSIECVRAGMVECKLRHSVSALKKFSFLASKLKSLNNPDWKSQMFKLKCPRICFDNHDREKLIGMGDAYDEVQPHRRFGIVGSWYSRAFKFLEPDWTLTVQSNDKDHRYQVVVYRCYWDNDRDYIIRIKGTVENLIFKRELRNCPNAADAIHCYSNTARCTFNEYQDLCKHIREADVRCEYEHGDTFDLMKEYEKCAQENGGGSAEVVSPKKHTSMFRTSTGAIDPMVSICGVMFVAVFVWVRYG